MLNNKYDLVIIGGGINGVGIARDAAGRGLKTLLIERDDLAGHTSSASTKLVHGGLRYLEQYEFGLVRKALREREVLLKSAPHIIWPMRFILPVDKGTRPAWMLRLGLFLYDNLGSRSILQGTQTLNLHDDCRGEPLQTRLKKGFAYSDCWVEDARLVALTARDAVIRGADIMTRTECTALERKTDSWNISINNNGKTREVQARVLINAAGPWVDAVTALYKKGNNAPKLRLVKGSHIVVRKKYEGDHSYIFQNADGRIIFAIPYEHDFTLIGTTDQPWDYSNGEPKISDYEIDYLCDAASEYFREPIEKSDIMWTYSGVRPLFDDHSQSASKVTRDYVFDFDRDGGAPILSIFGGKITTYRLLALDAMKALAQTFDIEIKDWTKDVPLPGGNFRMDEFGALVQNYQQKWPFIKPENMIRLVRAYGTDTENILTGVNELSELGQDLGCGLYEKELCWLIEHEFALSAEDVLWRRSKLGLHMNDAQIAGVSQWFENWQAKEPAKPNVS